MRRSEWTTAKNQGKKGAIYPLSSFPLLEVFFFWIVSNFSALHLSTREHTREHLDYSFINRIRGRPWKEQRHPFSLSTPSMKNQAIVVAFLLVLIGLLVTTIKASVFDKAAVAAKTKASKEPRAQKGSKAPTKGSKVAHPKSSDDEDCRLSARSSGAFTLLLLK